MTENQSANLVELARQEAAARQFALGVKYKALLLADKVSSAAANALVEVAGALGRTPVDLEEDQKLVREIAAYEAAEGGDVQKLQEACSVAHRGLIQKQERIVQQKKQFAERTARELAPFQQAYNTAQAAMGVSRNATTALEPLRLRWRSVVENKSVQALIAERHAERRAERRPPEERAPVGGARRTSQAQTPPGFTSTKPKCEERPTASGYEIPAQPVAAP